MPSRVDWENSALDTHALRLLARHAATSTLAPLAEPIDYKDSDGREGRALGHHWLLARRHHHKQVVTPLGGSHFREEAWHEEHLYVLLPSGDLVVNVVLDEEVFMVDHHGAWRHSRHSVSEHKFSDDDFVFLDFEAPYYEEKTGKWSIWGNRERGKKLVVSSKGDGVKRELEKLLDPEFQRKAILDEVARLESAAVHDYSQLSRPIRPQPPTMPTLDLPSTETRYSTVRVGPTLFVGGATLLIVAAILGPLATLGASIVALIGAWALETLGGPALRNYSLLVFATAVGLPSVFVNQGLATMAGILISLTGLFGWRWEWDITQTVPISIATTERLTQNHEIDVERRRREAARELADFERAVTAWEAEDQKRRDARAKKVRLLEQAKSLASNKPLSGEHSCDPLEASLTNERERPESLRPQVRDSGVVRWLGDTGRFGFITPDEGGADLFFYVSQVQEPPIPSVLLGKRVTFIPRAGKVGPVAQRIQLT